MKFIDNYFNLHVYLSFCQCVHPCVCLCFQRLSSIPACVSYNVTNKSSLVWFDSVWISNKIKGGGSFLEQGFLQLSLLKSIGKQLIFRILGGYLRLPGPPGPPLIQALFESKKYAFRFTLRPLGSRRHSVQSYGANLKVYRTQNSW